MKEIITTAILLASTCFYAQEGKFGFGTTTPKATLDVVGSPASTTTADGIILPRLTGNQLAAKDAVYLADQTGVQVYVIAAATSPAGKTINVTAPGYYYFDGTVWQKLVSGANGSKLTNDASNTSVRLTNLSDGETARPIGTEFVVSDSGSVGIGIETPNATALLDINSTTKGVLLPRLNSTERAALVNPATWLTVIDTSPGFGGLITNVGTPAAPNWATGVNLLATYGIRTQYGMGFNTNGGGYFSSGGLNFTGTGPSGYTYGVGAGTNGGYYFTDGGRFTITTLLPAANNTGLPAVNSRLNAFTVANSGNVGLGLIAPLAHLHLKAATSNPTDVQELRLATASNTAQQKIGFRQRLGFYGRQEWSGDETYSAGIEVLYGDNLHIPSFPGRSSTNMLFMTADRASGISTERLRISHNGNVGIGITTPSVRLDVNGAIKIGSETIATPTAGMIRFNDATSKFEGYDGTNWVVLH